MSEWQASIQALRHKELDSDKESLKESLLRAVSDRIPDGKYGILLSGGIDSSFISFLCKGDFICYCVGLEGADDLESATHAAMKMGLKLKTRVLSLDEAEHLFKKVAAIVPRKDSLSIGVGAVEYAAAEMAKQDGITKLFTGLGSEEIFAGYERHREAEDKHEECWKGLLMMYGRDITRLQAIGKALEINWLTPFLDLHVIENAMATHIDQKINDEGDKLILREIAEEIGLPLEFCQRKKKAAQYGSRFDKAIIKLSKGDKQAYLSRL